MSHKYACSTEGSTEGEGSIKARAVGIGLHISSKHAVEVCSLLRKKSLGVGIAMLEDVIKERQPVPFRRYKHNVGHRKGVGAGRYPKKACGEIIRLLKAVRSNASVKGLSEDLAIEHICSHKAGRVRRYGRHSGRSAKRTTVEVVVAENKGKEEKEKSSKKRTAQKRAETGNEASK